MFDYPALSSAAALQAVTRHVAHALGAPVEAYRVFSRRSIEMALGASGFRLRDTHRQFVLPIALHKRLNSGAGDRADRRGAASRRPDAAAWFARHPRGRALRVLVTGATGFTGGHLARALVASGDSVEAADPLAGAGARRRRGRTGRSATFVTRAQSREPRPGVEVIYHIAAIYRQAGLRDQEYRAVNAAAVRTVVEAAAPALVPGASSTAARSASTAISSIRPRQRTRRSSPGDIYQVTKLEGERIGRGGGRRYRDGTGHRRGPRAFTVRAIADC